MSGRVRWPAARRIRVKKLPVAQAVARIIVLRAGERPSDARELFPDEAVFVWRSHGVDIPRLWLLSAV